MWAGGKKLLFGAAALMVSGPCDISGALADASPPLFFTADQADRGRVLYDIDCASCHGSAMDGGFAGPALKGPTFRVRWEPQPGDALLNYMRQKMPPGSPELLDNAGYTDILAYILKINGAKAGAKSLPAEAAKLAEMSLTKALPPLPPRTALPPPPKSLQKPDAAAQEVMKARSARLKELRDVTDDMLQNPPAGSWLNWRRTYDAQGFSPLNQIDRSNVGKLQVAWSWKLQPSTNEITPLVHDGIMFITSGGRLQALDAATGDVMWQYYREGASGKVRGLAIYHDKIYFASSDAYMTALDMRTGAVVWERRFSLPTDHLRFSAGPLIAKGKVIQGMSGCDKAYPGGCFIVGLDAETGKEDWRFYTLPRPDAPGGDSWNGAPVEKRIGGSVWTTGSYDPQLDLVYFGTGQTYRIGTLIQGSDGEPGSNAGLYTDSTLALRPDSGELVWAYQHLARDVWDLDWSFERVLHVRMIDGKPRKTVTTAGKIGIFDTLDAATGQYLGSYDVGLQNVVTAIDPNTGAKTTSAEVEPEPNVEKLVCPSTIGHRNWPATAYDPRTGIVYVPLFDNCMPFMWTPGVPGDYDTSLSGMTPIQPPNSDGLIGEVRAFDLASGKRVWAKRRRAGQSSAMLATGGDLVFEGSVDRWFRALDARTGKVLWQMRLDGSPSAFPITYTAEGVQYVAITTGGGNTVESYIRALTSEITAPAAGVTLWAFRLPENTN